MRTALIDTGLAEAIKVLRTSGGTLIAAIAPAERGPVESQAEAKRAVSAAMRTVGERLGNTLPWPVPRTSVRPWSSSTWTGERSLISCALSAPGTWGWT